MSTVLESLPASAVAAARAALEAAQAELGELDRRIAACEQELELRDIARRRHQMQDR
jgi:hypothetical protein